MILDDLKNWTGAIEINRQKFASVQDALNFDFNSISNNSSIYLYKHSENAVKRSPVLNLSNFKQVKISVKRYMTEKSTPDFDFMKVWNNDIPMPLLTMVGIAEKETNGMYYMKLHGDITGQPIDYCLRCGREITNKVSKYFGMGPVCGNHNYTNPFDTEEELKLAIDEYRMNYISKITWEGWVIKSAITKSEIIEE